MKTAEDIIRHAAEVVSQSPHGDKKINLEHIATIWNGILHLKLNKDHEIDAHDVANMMEGLKIARRYTGVFNPDDYIDGVGYAACAFEVHLPTAKGDIK